MVEEPAPDDEQQKPDEVPHEEHVPRIGVVAHRHLDREQWKLDRRTVLMVYEIMNGWIVVAQVVVGDHPELALGDFVPADAEIAKREQPDEQDDDKTPVEGDGPGRSMVDESREPLTG